MGVALGLQTGDSRLHRNARRRARGSKGGMEANRSATEFRILGPLEVLDGGRPVALGGPKQRALLAALLLLLLLLANEVVSQDMLIDDL